MTTALSYAIAALIASVLTYLELDERFYLPPGRSPYRRRLWSWIAGFAAANAAIAVLAVVVFSEFDWFTDLHWGLQGVAAALSYMALVRLKFATFPNDGSPTELGIEAAYDASKRFVFKRINALAKKAREIEVDDLVAKLTLKELILKARASVQFDELMDETTRETHERWVLRVAESDVDELEKKVYLANYLCSGRQPAQPAKSEPTPA